MGRLLVNSSVLQVGLGFSQGEHSHFSLSKYSFFDNLHLRFLVHSGFLFLSNLGLMIVK